jgi:hypothetical protein
MKPIRAAVTGIAHIAVFLAYLTVFFPSQGLAATVNVEGLTYELSSIKTTYSGNEATFQNTPWWGDLALAEEILKAFVAQYPNTTVSGGSFDRYIYGVSSSTQVNVLFFINPDTKILTTANFTDNYDYVVGTILTSVPEINAGALSQVFLILFALWLVVTRRRDRSRVA